MTSMTIRRAQRAALCALALAVIGDPTPAAAQEHPVGLDRQTGLAVTIYNENLALVKDRRRVDLAGGTERLAFVDVSAMIRPETALLTGGGVRVVEQNFDYDLLTPAKLMEKAVGQKVRFIVTNPQTGAETEEQGTILSVAEGVVARIGDRIEILPPGRVVFSEVPPSLRARPTLVTEVEGAAAGPADLELAYLTGGLGWRADYVAELNAEESRLDLKGWVTLTNTSGTTYRDARLQLVAGEVNQVQPVLQGQVLTDVAAPMAKPFSREQLFEYHLYTLAEPTTIADRQTKQVALLEAAGVPVEKEYRFARTVDRQDWRALEPERVNAEVWVSFHDTAQDHLGQPLPKGIVRVYKADTGGRSIFAGEDQIDHTPEGEWVRLQLGRAFDLTATGKQTDFSILSDRIWEGAYAITIKNAKPVPVTVSVLEQFPGDWRILSQSLTSEKRDARTARWRVTVPAKGEATLTYRVRVTTS
jgi:hypothetical protein